jgi:hypothetical protein
MTKNWKIAIKDKNYGVRGHKLFAILEFVLEAGSVSYTELNRFSYNYSRRCKKSEVFTGKKYDKVRDRGYLGNNLYSGGYLSLYLCKTKENSYTLSMTGRTKIIQLRDKFGVKLFNKFRANN